MVECSAEKWINYIARISGYQADQLVFVDESSVNWRTTYCGHAWSIRGTQAQRKAFFVCGRRYVAMYILHSVLNIASFSVLPAISLNDGILHCKIVEGSFCTETFSQFIEGLLDNMQLYPGPNSVIVMDNCRIHKHPHIQDTVGKKTV